ncbi:MAG TPA: methyltransferase domain-containing protein [Candidatus Korarchaeota archaeon]|nr:methyltransferase domain-containing protein [Candidatus Korarchaeota archaeon]
MRILTLILCLLLLLVFHVMVIARIVRRFIKVPCPHQFVRLIENPVRRVLFGPEKVLNRAGILPGMRILELGPGGGFLTVEVANIVGEQGIVCCIDIQPEMIKTLRKKAKKLGLEERILEVVGDASYLPYPDRSFDIAYMVAVLGEIPEQRRAIREIWRMLKNGGTLSITEILPDPDYSLPRTVRRLCEGMGFKHVSTRGNLFCYTSNFIKGD